MKDIFLDGKLYYLRFLKRDDINERYLSWMNDREVTKYMDCGAQTQTLQGLVDFWEKHQNEGSYLLAIIDRENDKHIGNVKLAILDKAMRVADLGMLVGEKDYWGKSCMYEVYGLLIDYAFNKLSMRKITLGADINNIAAIITIKKLGFRLEKIIERRPLKNGRYMDTMCFGLSSEDCRTQKR